MTELECLAAVLSIRKFRSYVEGLPFTVITDHASLKWLMGQKDLSGRLARWSLKLQAFNFKIEHRKGTANVVPDALSRMHIDEVVIPVGIPVDLDDAAFYSPEYDELRAMVNAHKNELPDLEVRDLAVYRRTQFRTGDETVDVQTIWKLWVPEELRMQVITNAHDPSSSAHGGTDKTIDLIRRYYYWPGMHKEVREYISNCATCKETKAPNQVLKPPMGKAFIAERPFQHLYVDLLGPYPQSKTGHTTILIVLDQMSKFVWLKPLKKASAKNISQFLEDEILTFVGAPESLLTDNGVQFIAKEFKDLLNRYGVQHVYTASHSPQPNASERVNRSIIAAIRAYVNNDHTTWDRHLSSIASALRNAAHSATGQSPHFIVFGQHMVQHAATYKLLRSIQSLPISDVAILPPEEFRDTVNQQITHKLQQTHQRNKERYDTRVRHTSFVPGQEVFVRNFKQSNFEANYNAKLGRQWMPARIVARKGSCIYDVADRHGKPMKVSFHAKDIRV